MVTTTSTFILIILGNLMLISIPNNILAQLTEEELESNKTKQELDSIKKNIDLMDKQMALLDAQIEKESVKIENLAELVYILLTNVLPIVASVFIAFITAFLAWRNERKKIPTAEEEKIINEIATNWYYHSHLKVYNNIWDKIQQSDNNKIVEKVWDYLCVKEFPSEDLDDINIKGFKSDSVKKDIQEYLAKRLNIKKNHRVLKILKKKQSKRYNEILDKIHLITDASSSSYYDYVRDKLLQIAEIAVLATLGEKVYNHRDYNKVFEESLKKLKRLMIFYRLREDKEVAKILLRSAVYNNMMNDDKNQTSSIDANNDPTI
jgi:hypothetical protein